MSRYTVKQLARLSGVSVRTLHDHDQIGLLEPAFVGGNRYRHYGRAELLRLQAILFHRELGVSLEAEGDAAEPLLASHRAWVAAMWDGPCSAQAYAGLAVLYTSHPNFRARYETIEPGVTDWPAAAMRAHAARGTV